MSNILITGASSGLGKELARTYRGAGHIVHSISKSNSSIDNINHITCDLENIHDIPYKLSQLLDGHTKEIDTIFLNAGVLGEINHFDKVGSADFLRVFFINTMANKIIIDYLIRNNIKVKQVVALSSGASQHAYSGWGNYSISKAALNMMMKVYAEENPDTHFLSISPGPMDTSMQDLVRDTKGQFVWKKRFIDMKAAGRLANPREVAEELYKKLPQMYNIYKSGTFKDLRDNI